MPGLVVRVLLEAGAELAIGEVILVLEAVKTQWRIVAHLTGVVESVRVEVGRRVAEEQVRAIIVEQADDQKKHPADCSSRTCWQMPAILRD